MFERELLPFSSLGYERFIIEFGCFNRGNDAVHIFIPTQYRRTNSCAWSASVVLRVTTTGMPWTMASMTTRETRKL